MSLSNHPSVNDPECVTLDVDQYVQTLHEREEQQALKQRKKERKKLKKKLLEEQEAAGSVVEFIGPSGEVFEMRAWSQYTQSKYDVKLSMANERTFFKYLFSGIHTAAISTFLLTCFTGDQGWGKVVLLGLIAVATACVVAWGLGGYYQRKALMEEGVFREVGPLNTHGPAFVLSVFVSLFVSIIIYAWATHQVPNKHNKMAPLNALLPY